MSIKDELQKFYDAQAEKYYQTRNKHRDDADIFLDEIRNCGKKTISILEFGCGSGRLLAYLKDLKWIKINYTGVDISKNLLSFAKKQISDKAAAKHIQTTFVCDDIVHHLKWLKQESFDFVIGVASFQHISTLKERFFVIKNIYRILKYEGKLLMSNRSFSLRFLRKYQKDLLSSLRKYVISFGKHQRNDIMIPRKNGETIHKRFYHIYTLTELKKIISLSWFVTEKIWYLSKWNIIPSRKESQNTLVIAKKSIFLQNE
ncbi:MAG: methyltransferase type 11 [uncultured bacterium (gcode 4)]|uniref:Methyltransferase type 11 n=1 Tax=uncultured bacterium (gcode 4) TaxID=1234023 RepID=K1XXF3_9BACT|nr:MAG: methyltransferase type 11 [uncultured bacterium (gcode 4)]